MNSCAVCGEDVRPRCSQGHVSETGTPFCETCGEFLPPQESGQAAAATEPAMFEYSSGSFADFIASSSEDEAALASYPDQPNGLADARLADAALAEPEPDLAGWASDLAEPGPADPGLPELGLAEPGLAEVAEPGPGEPAPDLSEWVPGPAEPAESGSEEPVSDPASMADPPSGL